MDVNKRLVITGLVLLLAFCWSAFAQEKKAVDVRALYNKGMKAHQDKDFALFLDVFKKLDQLRPMNGRVMYNLACGYALTKNKAEAVGVLKKLVAFNADRNILKDADFASIRDTKEFKEVIAAIEAAWKPVSNSTEAFRLKEKDLHPEGIAYDPVKKRFYLSSVRKRKLVSLDEKGHAVDFTAQGQDGLGSVLGVCVDAKNREIWATSNCGRHMVEQSKHHKGWAYVFKYHLDTKKLIKKYKLEGEEHGFDEVIIHENGDAYLSDQRAVYRIPRTSDQLEVFIEPPEFRSVQGLAFAAKGKKLLVSDYGNGVFVVDIASRKLNGLIKHQSDISLAGIDGLYAVEQGKVTSIIGIHNGLQPKAVYRYELNPDLSKVVKRHIIDRAHPLFEVNEPTLGVVVGKELFYIANSSWRSYDKDFNLLPEKVGEVVILKASTWK